MFMPSLGTHHVKSKSKYNNEELYAFIKLKEMRPEGRQKYLQKVKNSDASPERKAAFQKIAAEHPLWLRQDNYAKQLRAAKKAERTRTNNKKLQNHHSGW